MICPFCRHDDSRVVDSRPVEDGTQIRRRRECPECGQRFSTQDDLVLLAQRVEETLRATGQADIEAQEVGLAILAPLRELDEVAYLRYASVYRNFTSLEDFEVEIALLRAIPSSANSQSTQSNKTSSNQSNSPITDELKSNTSMHKIKSSN
jgi:transcriptional repressor NrdR